MRKTIRDLVQAVSRKNFLIIGDTIVDKTTYTKALGLSLESPTLKAQFINETISLGGAANIAQHLTILGANCFFLTNIVTERFRRLLYEKGINLIGNKSENKRGDYATRRR